jgi:hypothetical protein
VTARWVPWVIGGAAAALAFWCGARMSRPAGAAAAPPATVERVVVERPAPTASTGGLTRDDLREIVRDELAQRAAAPAAADPDPPARAAEVHAAVVAANAAVSDGIARGVWGETERAALRPQLAHLGSAEVHDVLIPLFQAINAQRLRLDGPPL